MARAKCACGVLETLGFAETNCSEPESAGRVYNMGLGKYRLPLAEVLFLRPGDQNLTLLAYCTKLWFLTEIVICLQRLFLLFHHSDVCRGARKGWWRTPPTTHSNQFQLFHDSSRQQYGVTVTRCCNCSCFVLLKMGDRDARNM